MQPSPVSQALAGAGKPGATGKVLLISGPKTTKEFFFDEIGIEEPYPLGGLHPCELSKERQ